MALVQQVAEEGSWQGELSYKRKDGTTFPAHLHAFAIRDEQGETQAVAGILRDMTERKQTEEALLQSQERLQFILEGSSEGAWDWNIAENTAYLSPRYWQMLGFTPDEWSDDPAIAWIERIHPDDKPVVMQHLNAYLNGEIDTYRIEHRVKHKSGEWRWMLTRGKIAARDVQGKPIRMTGMVGDIHDRKQAEEELRHNQAFLQSVLDHIPAVIFIKDLDGYYQLINSFGLEASQLEREQVLYKRAADFLSADIADKWRTRELEVISSSRAVQSEDTLETDQGSKTFFTVTFPIFNANQSIIATGGIAIDITDRKRAEHDLRRSKERLRSLSRQLVMVQEEERRALARELHDEVGQALTAVKLTMGKVADIADAQVASRLENARTIVNDLMAQVRNLSLKLRPPMLDDMGLLSTLEWHFERYTDQTQVQVHFEHQGIEERFPADIETAIYRIVQEALTNVARYAEVEEVTVHISADQREIQVEIHDQGRGFDYHKVQATSSGLLGMRERIGLLGGKFWVDTAPGAGTRIQVEVPLDTPPPAIADG
jgi:PAS domain S-box-containing protein